MIPSHKFAAVLLAALAGAVATFPAITPAQGQTAATPRPGSGAASPINHTLVVLDAAHGGSDSGAVLGDHVLEKDVTLAIVSRLRTALTTNGFSVVATRDSDGTDLLSTDQRAGIANRAHAVACIVLHATATGTGVHLYTSALQPPAPNQDDDIPVAFEPIPWNSAQTSFVRQSLNLAGELSTVIGKNHLPVLVGQTSMRPLDNLMCPAVVIELAPFLAPGVGVTPASDANYQQQVANALAEALRTWRDKPDLSPAAQADRDGHTTTQRRAIAAAEASGRTAAKAGISTSGGGSQAAQKGSQ